MLEQNTLEQVKAVFHNLQHQYTLRVTTNSKHAKAQEIKEFVTDFATTSHHLEVEITDTNE